CWSHRVWSLNAWRVYQAMENECHPVWQDYHFGRIRAGDAVEDVIARTAPTRIERKGRWVMLDYDKYPDVRGLRFTGLGAVAYDGRMVYALAWSCTWVRLFFDEMTEDQSLEVCGCFKDDPRRFGIVPVYR